MSNDPSVEDLAYLITAHRFRERGLRGVIGEPDLAVARPMAAFLVKEGWRPPVSVPEDLAWRNTLSYAATALEGSADNGDRYCASQIRAVLAAEVSSRPVPDLTSQEVAEQTIRESADANRERDAENARALFGAHPSMRPVPDTEDDREHAHRCPLGHPHPIVSCRCVDCGDWFERAVPSQTPEPTDAQVEAAARAIAAEQGVRFGPGLSDTWIRLARAALVAAARFGTKPEQGSE